MTPMIDMAFQLIAFFMVLVNFSETVADQTIKLPISELARPADEAPQNTLVLNVSPDGFVRYLGRLLAGEEVDRLLAAEQRRLRDRRELLGKDEQMTVVVRSDADTPSGRVQELIQLCQKYGFTKFILRAREREG